jgi:alkyl hydroperoxide reductase subunit AhpC
MLLPMKRHILLTAIVSALLIFAIVPSFASSFSLSSGQNAPDFHLADLSNTNLSLSDYKGNIVVLDFFSVGYSTCQAGAKNVLVPLYNNYSSGDANVKFLSVETTGATADTINSTYVNSTGIKWPILTGGDNLKNLHKTNGTPTVYIVDPTGKIVFSMAYPLKTVALKAAINPLLEASANEKSKTTPDNKSTATPTPTNPSAIPTEKPSTTPTPTPTPAASNAILDANTSNVSKVTPSSESTVASSPTSSESTVASSPTSSESTVASSPTSSESVTPVSTTSGIQEENSSAGLENCSMAVTQKACVSTSSQTYLMYSPSLITSIVPSTVLAQVATMSAEATALSQNAVPTIALPAQTNSTASLPLQSVYEFSLLGLGAPALLIGVLYLLLRKV